MRLRLILLLPFILVLVLFALSNTHSVSLSLWPTGLSIEAPLSAAILTLMAIAFLLGALLSWISGLSHRRRARRAEARLAVLETELVTLRARPQ